MIPALIAGILTALVFILKSKIIVSYDPVIKEIFFLKAEKEAVQLLLSSIATSIMTVLGVVFSVIVVVMAQMSSQHTPRVVSNFTRSTMAQVVLGFYVGTFIYNLILLMNLQTGEDDNKSLAVIAVAGAFFLAITCLILLIFYIHHVTQSIQSTGIIGSIAKETVHSLRNISSDRREKSTSCDSPIKTYKHDIKIISSRVGYIEFIDWNRLTEKISSKKWNIYLHVKTGNFIQKNEELMTFNSDEDIDSSSKELLQEMFRICSDRTYSQDFEYGIQKLKDMGLRALSPGINDPSTAIEVINALTVIFSEYQKHPDFNKTVRIDADRSLSFLPVYMNDLLKENFDHLSNFSSDHPNVKSSLRKNLEILGKSI